MKTCRDLQQIHHLSRAMYLNTPKRLVEAFEDVIKEAYGYLVINNLTGSGDEDIRLSTHILPGQDLILYVKK